MRDQGGRPQVCGECGLPFDTATDREIHAYLRHAVQPSWFEEPGKRGHTSVCPTCGHHWGRGLGLAVHRGVAHPEPEPTPAELFPGYTPLAPLPFRFTGHRSRPASPPPGASDD
ncbi:hypothetical protein [Streptomyces sp. NPDC003710]